MHLPADVNRGSRRIRSFRIVFVIWLIIMLGFFVLANFAGLVRAQGVQPFRHVGFPLTFLTWKWQDVEEFNMKALAIDIAIAALVSIIVAAACAHVRTRGAKSQAGRDVV